MYQLTGPAALAAVVVFFASRAVVDAIGGPDAVPVALAFIAAFAVIAFLLPRDSSDGSRLTE